MDKRTFLAIGISLLIIVIYQYLFPPVAPKVARQGEQRSKEQAQQASAAPQVPAAPQAPGGQAADSAPAAPDASLVPEAVASAGQGARFAEVYRKEQAGRSPRSIKVRTDLYEMSINTKGAVITSWLLNDYRDKEGKPVELVSEESVKRNFYPLSLQFDDPGLSRRNQNAVYEADSHELKLDAHSPLASLTLAYTDPSGLKISKELQFSNDNYYVSVTVKQQNLAETPLLSRYYLAWGYNLGREKGQSKYHYTGPISYIDEELVEDKPDDIEGKVYHKGNISWTALQDVYFASILIPHTVVSEVVINKDEDKLLSMGLYSGAGQVGPGETLKDVFGLYAGPKKMEPLAALDMNLDKIIDYGWFDILAKPLMRVLNFFNRYTHNYGWDIIILTVLIKIIFFPLTTASFKSMRSMQTLQPKIAHLRKKYKNDPQKLNSEIMELYKKHKVNPLGGCMPMLLQIPVFFALYKALLMSIELRHAPFIFWITDLSAKDPYYITPILMGVSMFVQQKMTPSSGDPKQAKLMLILPVVFTFMFLNFPSGLVIYWLLNNILGIGQQYWINTQDQAGKAA